MPGKRIEGLWSCDVATARNAALQKRLEQMRRRARRTSAYLMNTIHKLFCILVVGYFASASLSAAEKKPDGAKKFKNVGVEEFDKLRADKKNVVLDVRTKKEFDAGHIPGAVNMDWNGPDFAKKAGELDKNKTYLVHCAAGGRSAKACDLMSGQLQFGNCLNLESGFRGWEKAGKAVEK